MQKRAPTLGNMLVIILFVLSCFGLLLFLWESFGGPLPLKPKGYRMTVSFPKSLALAEQSDVRISGVNVGRVVSVKLGHAGRTRAEIEVSQKYAPIRANMHAILRQKTLLGETYVQLIPQGGGYSGPFLPDKGQLADSQVEPSVTLDGILSAFDPKTRRAFQIWQQSVAEGIGGRGEQVNAAFASLEPFVEHANSLVGVLASQEGAVRALVHNTGVVFNALASRDHQLEGLIVNGERTFHAAAEGSQAFANAFRALPTFESRSRVALKEIDRFATDASPFLDEFRTVERKLSPLLSAAKPFAPQFDSFLTSVGPLTKAAKKGLPDVGKTLDFTTAQLENLRPVLHNLDPFLQYLGEYVPELQAFFANFTAATQAHATNANIPTGPALHYLRSMQVLGPESLSVYSQRIGTDRSNPYFKPGAFRSLGNLQVFSSSSCANSAPSVSGPPNETIPQSLIDQLIEFQVANTPETPNAIPAPACNQQGPFTFNGQTSQFPHVLYGGKR
ncbi:MAG TPA: MlaD family protein [Solirubrobacteraceae bacterium]|jgi:phospholipid/cholesterol/gamma-HCH transport system substrate-binding protein|nr:MlaD family protein [Solirubrobacteraceae bacterium]